MQHLRIRLRPIHRALSAAGRRQMEEIDRLAGGNGSDATITSEQAGRRLSALEAILTTGRVAGQRERLTVEEALEEEALRACARQRGETLPLDRIMHGTDCDLFDVEVLLVCAAIEIDPRFSSVIAFLQDDTARRRPTIGLLASLTASELSGLPERRRALGRIGRLRRLDLLRVVAPAPTEAEQELALGPRVLAALLGNEIVEFRDPLEITTRELEPAPGIDRSSVNRLVDGLRDGHLSVVGVWGPRQAEPAAVVHTIGAALHRPLRRLPPLEGAAASEVARVVEETAADAAALDAILWLDMDALDGTVLRPAFAEVLARTRVRICLSGVHPFRPSALLAARPYAELALPAPSYAARQRAWSTALPELPASHVGDLAARYRLDTDDLAAVARIARTSAVLASNGHVRSAAEFVEPACAQLVRKRSHQFARVITPRRGPDDLVLAPDLFRQVMEVGQAFRAWPRVSDLWGLGRTASGGLKALFTGEPGTGKTLAAEVIATQLGLPLVRIDLAQIVSKWIGETEKNLESVFREAEDGNALLFFDEAEALFGKRGEVRHGTDRYANLEVSYLLQRLEEHEGLVILASNLKDEIDTAFTRRFHAVLHFPRPTEPERRRLWRLALPDSLPLEDAVDLVPLARLDLTGAGIVAAARTAALHAAQEGSERIGAAHLVFGVARQFQRESRLLTATDLGAYAAHLSRPR